MTLTRLSCSALFSLIALFSMSGSLASANESMKLRSFDDGLGNTYFAASLGPIEATPNQGTDVVIVVDTSASQTGVYRDTAFSSVEACLASLGENDRVQIVAADLDARPMSKQMASVGSAELAGSMSALKNELPLGSTDLDGALRTAAKMLGQSEGRQRTILYIGDGISSTAMMKSDRLKNLAAEMQSNKIAVSSYAIGPQRDSSLLARLANLTGGNLYIDQPMVWADQAEGLSVDRAHQENINRGQRVGRTLAQWAKATVVWPSEEQSSAKHYPASMLPLRSDRDTILIGSTSSDANEVEFRANVNGSVTSWASELPESNDTNAYLSSLVKQAKVDDGVSLTTIGTAGLEETGRNVLAQIDNMTQLAEHAASMGDVEGASQISQAVLRRDPGNMRAQTVQRFVSEGDSILPEGVAPVTTDEEGLKLVRTAQLEVVDSPQPAEYFDDGNYPPAEATIDGRFIDSVTRNSSVYAQALEKEVQNTVANARDIMREDPETAIQNLKLMLLNVERSPELVSSVRAGLRDRLQTTLRQANSALQVKDDLDREREALIAAGRERRLLLDRMELKREQERQLLNKFTALMREHEYKAAEDVATVAREHNPEGVEPRVAQLTLRAREAYEFGQEMRDLRDQGFLDAMAGVERSAIPFSDETPIVYPDAETWIDLTQRRKEYAAVDLAGKSESEEAINRALSSPLTSGGLDFQDTALEEIIDFLREEYQIEIQIDEVGLDDLGLDSSEPVTVNLRNISLRSALRLMLKPLELTYVIDDEVLLITSEDEALTRLTFKVYPVADLVIPIETPQVSGIGGGIGGGGGGGFGGGGGGGGFGGGGGGGGFGGGGGGFGGGGGGRGGGAFAVPDVAQAIETRTLTLSPVTPKEEAQPVAEEPQAQVAPAAQKQEQESIQLPAEGADAQSWNLLFEGDKPAQAAVRDAARQLMKERRFHDTVEFINAALRNGAAQPWMYESLGIALQLSGADDKEVERAIMSAVDFATSPDHLLVIADYLRGLGLDKRVVQVCRLAVEHQPMLHESYALALRSAERSEDMDSIAWASSSILSKAWAKEHTAIEEAARLASKALIARLESEGLQEKADEFKSQLEKAKRRDCVIRVSWSGDADVDLAVQEPGGTMCSSMEPRTTAGGVLIGDSATSKSNDHCETYVCPEGFSGDYRVAVRKVWGEPVANTVSVEVILDKGAETERNQSQQFQLEDGKDAVVEFSLAEGRLKQPIEEHQIAQAIERQRAVSQAVLSQQISSLADDPVTSLRPDEVRRRRRALGAAQAAVGFQPVIITLPNGTNFQATATISADRRYVRVTPVPFFSGVSEVSSFSFVSGGGGPTVNNTTNNTTTNETNNNNINAGNGGS